MIVIGSSAGGIVALKQVLSKLEHPCRLPIVIAQHLPEDIDEFYVDMMQMNTDIMTKEVKMNEKIEPGVVYFAPPGYHLLIEDEGNFSLSADERVNFVRPSIDVLFETAASVFKKKLTAIVLTGANKDGSYGAATVKKYGGKVIVQDPKTAYADTMPLSVINTIKVDKISSLEEISELLVNICKCGDVCYE